MPAPNVKVIPARDMQPKVLRVAAYCRVSSDSADQLHSYAAQIRYYTDLINSKPEWELADIYADEARTGTRADKREDFQRLMTDCRNGKIDVVLVKSISRFARNTRDCLCYLRELNGLGISVRFEEENIDTKMLTSELMVSVFGSLAQQESISISQNMRMSYQRRMEKGEFITCTRLYGYRIVNGSDLEIVEEEATWVRWIFAQYLSGKSSGWIAAELERREVPNKRGQVFWPPLTIRYMLGNEKYIGDALAQKSYTAGFPFHSQRNHGDCTQYYTQYTHPPIISREDFQRVQALRQVRTTSSGNTVAAYPLSRKIQCGVCGTVFLRKERKDGTAVWVCRRHHNHTAGCPVGRVQEENIYAAFVGMYNKLLKFQDILLGKALGQYDVLLQNLQRGNKAFGNLNHQIAEVSQQHYRLTQLHTLGSISGELYLAKQAELGERLKKLHQKRRAMLQNDVVQAEIDRLEEIQTVLRENPEPIAAFQQKLFDALVERISIDETSIRFVLLGGLTLEERR